MLNPGTPPPPHVGGPILPPGSVTVMICGQPAARVGDMAQCSGPPDTILPPGCPTVMIGDGGGGGGGGGGGSGGEADADTTGGEAEEPAILDVRFVDGGGFPITGLNYRIDAPDGSSSSGLLTGQVRQAGQEGDYTISLRAITKCEWSSDSARDDETVKMQIETAGIDDGTTVVFSVWERNPNQPDREIATIRDIELSGDKAEAEWQFTYDDDHETRPLSREERPLLSPSYYFSATAGDCTAQSPVLQYQDYIEITARDNQGNVLSDQPYRVTLANGEVREGQLDGNGYAKVENVPPGPWDVVFPQHGNIREQS
jgi:hypothetical protein